MGPIAKEYEIKIIRKGGSRLVEIPDDFFLSGEKIIVRQERDGVITIYPAEKAAREAMSDRFNPLVEWENGTWPDKLETPE